MSLGLHNDLITEWKDDFTKSIPVESMLMGLFHPLPVGILHKY